MRFGRARHLRGSKIETGFAEKEDLARIKVDPLFDDIRDDRDLQIYLGE